MVPGRRADRRDEAFPLFLLPFCLFLLHDLGTEAGTSAVRKGRVKHPQHRIAPRRREHHGPHHPVTIIARMVIFIEVGLPRRNRGAEVRLKRRHHARLVDDQLVHPDPLVRREGVGHEGLGDDVAALLADKEEEGWLLFPAGFFFRR